MQFDLRPQRGVGPVGFGLEREAVRRLLAVPFLEFRKAPWSTETTDDFRALSLHVFYDARSRVRAAELFPPADAVLDGHPLLGRPLEEVMAWLTVLDPAAALVDSVVTAPALGLGLYVPDADDDPAAPIESAHLSRPDAWE